MYVMRGDYSCRRTLGLAGIERARVPVIADDKPEMMHRVISLVMCSMTTRLTPWW
jgi:hypothetical protein